MLGGGGGLLHLNLLTGYGEAIYRVVHCQLETHTLQVLPIIRNIVNNYGRVEIFRQQSKFHPHKSHTNNYV